MAAAAVKAEEERIKAEEENAELARIAKPAYSHHIPLVAFLLSPAAAVLFTRVRLPIGADGSSNHAKLPLDISPISRRTSSIECSARASFGGGGRTWR